MLQIQTMTRKQSNKKRVDSRSKSQRSKEKIMKDIEALRAKINTSSIRDNESPDQHKKWLMDQKKQLTKLREELDHASENDNE